MTQALTKTEAAPVAAFNQEQTDLLKRTICKGSTDDEFALFAHVAKRTGLDPFARQLHAVKRWDASQQREVMSIQTGIDGYRLIADRTGAYAPGREPTFTYANVDKLKLISATAYVKKLTPDGTWHEVAATAHYTEYVATKKGGEPNHMWATKSHIMLSKCAEALALRRAFPAELSGLYTSDEMGQADNAAPQAKPAAKRTYKLKPASLTADMKEQDKAESAPEPEQMTVDDFVEGVVDAEPDGVEQVNDDTPPDDSQATTEHEFDTGQVEQPDPSVPCVPFGKNAGMPVTDLNQRQLSAYLELAEKAIKDENKARYLDDNLAWMDALEAEQKRRKPRD